MGYAVPLQEPSADRGPLVGAGGEPGRGQEPFRRGAILGRQQAQELPTAHRSHIAGLHVRHTHPIRILLPAGN